MLIAHASSTCDVCLETYSEDCSYHSIPCGHVFCLPCLVSTTPAKCPLCRHEFSPYTMRKLHLTPPSPRDLAARRLETKLVQSSPEMSLAESLTLFQEVQDWLEGESQDEYLVLRAFAAVLCGFHETKDKLLQNQNHAEEREAELRRSLDEARRASQSDVADYKTRYKAAKAELLTLRTECAELRANTEQQRQAQYAQIQAQAQLQVQSQIESQQATRRISNPLPTPPRFVGIPSLKLNEAQPSGSDAKTKAKGSTAVVDPVTSMFVPTISSITTRQRSSGVGGPEITTLVFKPPKRMPVWDSPNTSYATLDPPGRASSDRDSSSEPTSYAGTSERSQVELTPADRDAPHRLSGPTPRPVSYTGANGHIGPPPVPPPLETSEQISRPKTHERPAFASSLRPLSYAGWPEPQGQLPPAVMDPPRIGAQRPAWQGGTGMGPRRASSPVVAHMRPHSNDLSVMVVPHGTVGEDQGRSNSHPVASGSYTIGDGPPVYLQRRPSHSPNKSRRPKQSDSEYRLRVRPHEHSPATSGDDAPRMSTRPHHTRRPSHDLSHSQSTHVPVTPTRLSSPSPMPPRERAHTLSYSYPAPPFALRGQHIRDDHMDESFQSRPANTFHMMDPIGPSLVPPMAEV